MMFRCQLAQGSLTPKPFPKGRQHTNLLQCPMDGYDKPSNLQAMYARTCAFRPTTASMAFQQVEDESINNATLCSLATIVCTVAQLCFHFACHCPKGVAIPWVVLPTICPALGKFLNKVRQVLRSTKPEQKKLDIEVPIHDR